jgi:hypothetical protein
MDRENVAVDDRGEGKNAWGQASPLGWVGGGLEFIENG